jgi:hypothetical protein
MAVRDDGGRASSAPSRALFAGVLLVALAALISLVVGGASASAASKGGKIHACVAKKGPDKGAMRLARGNRCKRGEKKLIWNKRGKAGQAGAPGETGPAGPAGAGGSTDQLLALIQQQQAAIDALTQQLSALCTQVSAVTSQSDALRTVISGLSLDGVIPIGLLLDIPGLPAPLGAFGCPA